MAKLGGIYDTIYVLKHMNMWHSIKRFFGLEKPVAPPPVSRPREALAAELAKLSPSEAIARLQAVAAEAEATVAESAQRAASPEELDARVELACFCYSQLHPQSTAQVDPVYERLLERIQPVWSALLREGGHVVQQLDQYIQRYEEYIYLTEAKGEYVLGRSEHGLYIRLPFMSGGILKSAQRAAAEKALGGLFFRSYALPFVELQAAVPWTPISFVDFMALAKERKMALVTDGTGYYACLDRA